MQRFDPSGMSGANVYKLMIGAIVPRPIAFVSSIDEHGVHNLAPFSYFTGCSSNPPVICFCATVRVDPLPETKDTYRNILATKEFVVNIVSEEFAEQMNACAAQVSPDIDEFTLSGLTPVASEVVRPPRVAESHVQMECRLRQVVTVSEKPNGGYLILGDVVLIHVNDAVLDGDKIDPGKLKAIGRMGGPTYVRTGDRFDLARPK
ncbi:flavin reductase family protein [Silvibacterium acidisoli]|uniref:flavin reductase family protein n=1 Tax=Acidobacteriaceae bacterium ZG23-2 TaxID=2883246 RepID=UPI00406D12DF